MFEEMIKELKKLDGTTQLTVSLPSDEDGYLDRECPSSDCEFEFKIHEDDWRDKVRDEEVFCPFCRHTGDSDSWWTKSQLKHAKEVAMAHVSNRLRGAMNRDARRSNRRQSSNSFLSMTIKVDNKPRVLPVAYAAEAMQLKITCEECQCRCAIVGCSVLLPCLRA